MGTPSSGYLRAAARRAGEPLKILTSPTHEGYEAMLAETGHQFYGVPTPVWKKWNSTFRRQPDNYIVTKEANSVPEYWDYDLVLIHSRSQYRLLGGYAVFHNLPLIIMEHTLPHGKVSREAHSFVLDRPRTTAGFVSDFNVEQWNFPEEQAHVIPQGVDESLFAPGQGERRPQLLSVVNKWQERDAACGYKLWRNVTAGLPTKVLGDNPGLSLPAENLPQLISEYQNSLVFLNTSLWSSSPLTLFEAMASGCAIVTTGTTSIPSVIEHGKNGLVSNDPKELREFCIHLLSHPEEAIQLGLNARKTAEENHSIASFCQNWNDLFAKALETA